MSNPEEIIESRFYELGKKIANFEEMFLEQKNLKDSLLSMNGIIECLRQDMREIFKRNDDSNDKFQHFRSDMISYYENHKDQLRLLKSSQDEHQSSIDSQVSLINSIGDRIGVCEKFKDEMKNLESKIFSIRNDISSSVYELKESYRSSVSNQSDMQSKIDFSIERLNQCEGKLSEFISLFENVKKDNESFKVTSFEYMDGSMKTMYDQMNKFFSAINDKMVKMENQLDLFPEMLENFKKDISHDLEMVKLNGSGAVLKAGNSEKQIQLMEKRIENIQLLLKKYELSL